MNRAETVDVVAGAAAGRVNRPTLLGSLIGKAAALKIMNDPGRERHITDFLTLASVVGASDLRGVTYQPAERSHLANMLGYLANNPENKPRSGGRAGSQAAPHVPELRCPRAPGTDLRLSIRMRSESRCNATI